jgi:hypothetical protein
MSERDVTAESDFERWLGLRGLGRVGEAACLTFVGGRDRDEILSAFGAQLDQPTATLDEALDDTITCVGVLAWGDGFIAIEPNGGEGLRPDLLRELSRAGAAASLFWNVNGMVVLSCASRGKARGSEELLDLRPDSHLPPEVLRPLLAAQDAGGESLVAALDAVARFVALPSDVLDLPPLTLYRVVPRLEELPHASYTRQSLEYDGPALLDLVDNASAAAQRRTAELIAGWTLTEVGLDGDPRAIRIMDQFGRDQPTDLAPALGLVLEVHRRLAQLQARDPSSVGGLPTPQMQAVWMQESAIRALRYTAVADAVAAAVGAIDCLTPFMRKPSVPDSEGRFPLPDPAAEVAAATELIRPMLIDRDRPPPT